jgi:hypothetical protein
MQYLGIQYALIKHHPQSQTMDAWAVGMLSSADGDITKSFTQEKWDTGNISIAWLLDDFFQAPDDIPCLNFKMAGELGWLSVSLIYDS